MTCCPACGGPDPAPRGGLLECGDCGLVFTPVFSVSPAVYAPGLEEGIYDGAKAALFSEALDILGAAFPRRGRLLDIGCASGGLMKSAAARGWEVSGVELDAALADKAEAAGFEVSRRPVEEAALPPGTYDAATVFEVFSQMEKPGAASAEIFRLLKPGGRIYAREFNAGFHLALRRIEMSGLFRPFGAYPSVLHDRNFRAATLRIMLERAGFRSIRIRNSRPTAGDPYRTGGRLGGLLTAAIKVLYYYMAQAVWLASFGRIYAGSALIVTAEK